MAEEFKLVTPEMLSKFVATDIECERDLGEGTPFDFKDAHYAGIGVACTVDQDGMERDWIDDKCAFRYFGYLNTFPIIMGYNVLGFDFPLIGGSLLGPENQSAPRFVENNFKGRTIDFAADVKEALGHRAKLERISIPTLGDQKEMDGKNAPNRYRMGKVLETIIYCRGDNRRLVSLVIMAVNGQELKYQTDNGIKTFKVKVKLR